MSAPAPTTTASPAAPTPKAAKGPKVKEEKPKAAAPAAAEGGDSKLTPKQLKEQKKLEKQARRAADKAVPAAPVKPDTDSIKKGKQQQQKPTGASGAQRKGPGPTEKHAQSNASAVNAPPAGQLTAAQLSEAAKDIPLFRHLENPEKRITVGNSHKDVHPAILALGLQMASFAICGSSARCVATLLAFKRVIEDYITPAHTTLARNLSSHHLSPQIEHLRDSRPMSISMRNAIRWLKLEISTMSIDLPEATAKTILLDKIDNYIREKITIADQGIVATAVEKIVDGDVIVTFAKSSIVQMVLIEAYRKGIKFRVVVVDSRPLLEGKQMCKTLAEQGISCTYTLIHALSYVIRDATKVYLGAHAMLSNGRLYSRVGTAAVAMYAKEFEVPVIVCCESIKFTDRVGLDSIVNNELGSPDELINISTSRNQPNSGNLVKWRDVPNLRLLNIMYDVTPAENITLVITEYGSLPPSSVPVVHRLSTNQ
ncbi:hypothetical protein DFH27DRAFT_531666 [Peziza echinospora]|nr:hypothetical protein DFH27DRAFT_531666 [Peziza echinospora]